MCSDELLSRIVMCRETGEDGSAQGRVRRLQGGDRAPRLPQPWYIRATSDAPSAVCTIAVPVKSEQPFSLPLFRYRDERVPAQERRVLARRGHQRDRLPGHVPGPGVRVPRGERRPLRGRRLH